MITSRASQPYFMSSSLESGLLQPLLGERRDHGNSHRPEQQSAFDGWRRLTRALLSSRWGHYIVLLLVSVDVGCIFADALIELHVCELKQKYHHVDPGWGVARNVLDLVGLVFSCLFMVELVTSIISFGTR